MVGALPCVSGSSSALRCLSCLLIIFIGCVFSFHFSLSRISAMGDASPNKPALFSKKTKSICASLKFLLQGAGLFPFKGLDAFCLLVWVLKGRRFPNSLEDEDAFQTASARCESWSSFSSQVRLRDASGDREVGWGNSAGPPEGRLTFRYPKKSGKSFIKFDKFNNKRAYAWLNDSLI